MKLKCSTHRMCIVDYCCLCVDARSPRSPRSPRFSLYDIVKHGVV